MAVNCLIVRAGKAVLLTVTGTGLVPVPMMPMPPFPDGTDPVRQKGHRQ